MAKDLKNKTVVVTGGAEGIGFEIADNYLRKQAKVVILLDVNEKAGAEAVKVLKDKYGTDKAVFYKCDVTTDLEVVAQKIFSLYKQVDVLVNNAGILDDKLPKKTIDINVTAVVEWGLRFWDFMRKDQGGSGGTIVNLASIYGYRIDQFLPVYQASKFAVMGFTKSLGHEYNFKKTGVRVVAICPGFTETKLTAQPKVWDDSSSADFKDFLDIQAWQKVDMVGKAAVDIFEKGAAEGIGFEIARSCLKEQAKLVILLDINEDKGNDAAEALCSEFGDGKAVFIKCNVVTDLEGTVQEIYDKYDKVDVLVNNAGRVDEKVARNCVEVNLTAVMDWSLKFLERMSAESKDVSKGGTILNIASIFGYRITPFCPVYHGTKFGVIGFTKALGHERNFEKNGVRMITICPGCTYTTMAKPLFEEDQKEFLEFLKFTPWQSPEELAEKTVEVFKVADSGSVWEIEGHTVKQLDN